MLRTCSLPDLTKLFKTIDENPFLNIAASATFASDSDDDEADQGTQRQHIERFN